MLTDDKLYLYDEKALAICKKYPRVIKWIIASLMHEENYGNASFEANILVHRLRECVLYLNHGIPKKCPNFSLVGCTGCKNVRMFKDEHSPQFVVVPRCNRCYTYSIKRRRDFLTLSGLRIFKDYGGYLNED